MLLLKLKTWLDSRTLNVATLLAVLGVIQSFGGFFETLLTPRAFGYWTLGIAVAIVVLRTLTTTPLGEKK